jgi:hypothetical protein
MVAKSMEQRPYRHRGSKPIHTVASAEEAESATSVYETASGVNQLFIDFGSTRK